MTDYSLSGDAGAYAISGAVAGSLYAPILNDGPVISELFHWAVAISIGDTVTTSAAVAYAFQPGAEVDESFHIVESHTELTIYGLTASEAVTLTTALNAGSIANLTETCTLTDATVWIASVLVADRLRLVDAAAAMTTYGVTLGEIVKFNSLLERFLGGYFLDTMTVTGTPIVTYQATAHPQDAMIIGSVLGNTMLLSVSMSDDFDMTDSQVWQMIYAGDPLLDGVILQAAYVDPGGDVTTWVVNTRTNAITEYQNWQFATFAQIGNKYVGGNAVGLFELDDATDAGANIPTYIRGGLMALGGSRFTMLSEVYIGMRAKDDSKDVFFKLITGDGKEYTYQARPRDMHTTKVKFGKGLRSRYFAWELSTTSVDFDLDSIEFVPVISKRRI